MFAIVEIAGFQYRVQESDVLTVPRLQAGQGEQVSFTNILVAGADEASAEIGMPTVSGAVKATVIEHAKADKVIIFHKKRRKGYRKKNGHRQPISRIKIESISLA